MEEIQRLSLSSEAGTQRPTHLALGQLHSLVDEQKACSAIPQPGRNVHCPLSVLNLPQGGVLAFQAKQNYHTWQPETAAALQLARNLVSLNMSGFPLRSCWS